MGAVVLKLAMSLDGRIAARTGESRWITGPEARAEGHRLRAASDAVLVGIGTALADDPELTVRLDGHAGPQPARVVMDSRQRLPLASRLVRGAATTPTYLVSLDPLGSDLAGAGVRGLAVAAGADGRPDPARTLAALKAEGIGTVLIEGGGATAAAFLKAGLVDRIEVFRAPSVLGGDGTAAVGPLGVDAPASAPRFRRVGARPVGEDLWETYQRL